MKKVERNGLIGVLYSPGFGAGWYSWNTDVPQCLFSPEIIEMVENNERDKITDELCKELFDVDYFYTGGADDLRVEWLSKGTHFDIHEYDGSESIKTFENIKLIA